MAKRAGWMIYGANGYTRQLVAVEATRRGLNPVLGGRRAGPIERLAAELNLRRGWLFGRSVRRLGADFLVPIIASRWGPTPMGPIFCARAPGLFVAMEFGKSAAR